jgi:DNA-binding transcriptional MerR regulator
MARPAFWRVGELAEQTGLTIRTLHYYDEIGLLSPSHRSDAGYRLYTAGDVVRLQQIRSLRHLGFSLEEIRGCLDRPGVSLQCVIGLHIARLKEQIALQRTLCERLEAIGAWLSSTEEVSVEELIHTMEVMSMVEKYYTPEQLAEIKERGRRLGEERIRQVEAEWPELIAQVRAEMEQGTDPASERVQALARRWMALVEEFTGGNPEIEKSLRTMYEQEPEVRERAGIDPRMFAYIGKAMAAARGAG